MLSQRDAKGEEKVIAYASRALSKPERNYCVTRHELLAAVYFSKYFQLYLLGQKFTLRTDHGLLTWLRNFREPDGQLARWLEHLQSLTLRLFTVQGISTRMQMHCLGIPVISVVEVVQDMQFL